MLAATSKVCPKGLVAFETLQAVHSKIVSLPVKEKKFFKTREAVDFLFQDIHDAIFNKNYTIEDISQYFTSAGWVISPTSLKQFWRLFRVCVENYKNSTLPAAHKEQHAHTKSGIRKRKNSSSEATETISNDTESLPVEHENISPMSSNESTQKEPVPNQNSAHFDLPPDTEDL